MQDEHWYGITFALESRLFVFIIQVPSYLTISATRFMPYIYIYLYLETTLIILFS